MVVAARILAWLVFPAATALALISTALADGEAGLVIQHGDGTVETFCVPFGDSEINGDDLLLAASVPFAHVSGLVCTIGDFEGEGCPGASSLTSCTCKCGSGGSECVYWSYFTREYGKPWVYSISGFTAQSSKDGEMQAWRWGPGGANSAPAPSDMTFEQVCGHPPARLRATETPAPAATPTPTAVSNPSTPPATAPASPPRSETTATLVTSPEPATATPSVTEPPAATVGAPATAVPPTSTRTPAATPVPDTPGQSAGSGSGGAGPASIAAFVGVAAALAAAIFLGLQRRSRRDV